MATTRLRRTFKYPDDEDGSDGRDEMDEEEQSALLSSLQNQNATSNQYLYPILLALPLVSTLPFLYTLFLSSPTSSTIKAPSSPFRLLAFLSLTSLLASTYTFGIIIINISNNDPKSPLHSWIKRYTSTGPRDGFAMRPSDVFGSGTRGSTSSNIISQSQSPLHQYLPRLNWALATLIAVSGFCLLPPSIDHHQQQQVIQHYFWLWCFIPGLVLVVLEISQRAMDEVEKGLEGLGGMRYEYKGA